MPATISHSAELTVHRPIEESLALFTAEGERTWAPGWNPSFPVPGRTEGIGAVFVTADAQRITTWIMIDQDRHAVRYARVTPEWTAGTVTVTVVESEPTRTRLRVSYDLTALSREGARWLDEFAADFTEYIAHWEAAIAGRPVRHK
jgi:hypothetical protein